MKQKGLNVELEIKLKRIIIGRNAPVIIFFEQRTMYHRLVIVFAGAAWTALVLRWEEWYSFERAVRDSSAFLKS